jgi:hypothetical protein
MSARMATSSAQFTDAECGKSSATTRGVLRHGDSFVERLLAAGYDVLCCNCATWRAVGSPSDPGMLSRTPAATRPMRRLSECVMVIAMSTTT